MGIKAKVIICIMLCSLLLTGLVLGSGCAKEPTAKESIKVGALIPATGAMAEHGKQATRGIQMALGEINAAGGVLGRPLEVIQVDNKYQPDVSIRAANTLLYEDEVDFFMGCLITSATSAVSEWAKDKKVLYIGFGVSDFLTMDQGHRYFFRGAVTSIVQQKGNVTNLKGKGINSVWTVAPDYAYGHQAIEAATKLIKELAPEIEIVGESWPPLDEKDFSPYITEIMASGADAVYSALFGGTQIAFIKQAAPFGFFDKMSYAGGDFTPVNVRPAGLEAAEGMLGYSQYEWLIPNIPENKAFDDKWMKAYGSHAYAFGALMYTNLHLLAKAIEEAGTTETEAVIDAMEKVHYASPYGDVYYRAYDHPLAVGVAIGGTMTAPDLDYYYVGKNARYFKAEEALPTVEEVKAMREAAK